MADRNAYFKLSLDNNVTSITIYPAEGKGKELELSEVEEYLKRKRIEYSATMLRGAVYSSAEKTLELQKKAGFIVNEETAVRISEDRMSVIFRFYPPAEGGSLVTEDEVKGDLKAAGVTTELDKEAFHAFEADRQYCTDYVLSRGKLPEEGKDGSIEYLFNTDLSVKPTVNPDGSVDFFHLNTICTVAAGQELAKLTPEIPGKPGCDVLGDQLQPREVKVAKFKYGRNMHVSEDGLTLISEVDGHVSLTDGTVFVSGVLELNDIGPATGNIDNYDGNLLIKGNVETGFSVKATGDIEVRGVVEGATVEAGGEVTVARGVNGMGRGSIKAGKNVIVKYIENATVNAGNYVQTECILNSTVTAKTNITVEGKKGFITGGTVRAGQAIQAKTIGSDMGSDTTLEVGVDPEKKARLLALNKNNEELSSNIKRIQPVLVAMKQRISKGEKFTKEQVQQAQVLSANLAKSQTQLKENLEEIQKLTEELAENDKAIISVEAMAYAGTKVSIGDTSAVLKKNYSYCRFGKKKGEISMLPMH